MTGFLDLACIKTLLAPLLEARTVLDLRILATAERATQGLLVRACPGLAIVPATSTPTGPQGLGNGRLLTERFDLVIQIEQLSGSDETAATQWRTIRTAVHTALEGQRPSPDWSPIRYQGGQTLLIANPIFSWVERYETQRSLLTV